MAKLDTVRSKLDKKLFNSGAVLRSTVTLAPYIEASSSFGGYSDEDSTYGTALDIAGVPYNHIPNNFNIQPFGDFQTGDMYVVFRYDSGVGIKDKVTFNSRDYFIKEIKEININDGVAAIIAQVRKTH